MSAFQTIETGIPFPPMDGRRTKRQRHYAESPLKTRWDLLRVGQSVTVKHATDRQAAYQWAKKYNVHLIVVAHPAKMARGKDGKYPVPGLYDISDSAHWSNKADVGVVVHREDLIESKETAIRVVKSRYHSAIGRPGEIKGIWNEETTRYTISNDGTMRGAA